MRKVFGILATSVFFAAVVGSTWAAGSSDKSPKAGKKSDVVKIGVLVPLNGSQTQAGVEVQALLKLFEKAINEKVDINLPFHDSEGLPNLGGAKVKFIVGDLSTPDIAMAEAERLYFL